MTLDDAHFRIGVVASGALLVAAITAIRFCGSIDLPPKSAPPGPGGTSRQLLSQANASSGVYMAFLEKDAAIAGVHTPTLEEMSRKLVARVDEGRHVLEVGRPGIEAAGLRLTAQHTADGLVLRIENLIGSDVAYLVNTEPSPNTSACNSAVPLSFNAMVIPRGQTETRVECVWRSGMALIVKRVETVEVSPLSAWYLSHLPPVMVGIEERIARGHETPGGKEQCSNVMPQSLRSGLDQGQIGWRDLIDFYARHRCMTYQFPSTYRAFKTDGEYPVPTVAPVP